MKRDDKAILLSCGDWATPTSIAEATGLGLQYVISATQRLCEAGHLIEEMTGGRLRTTGKPIPKRSKPSRGPKRPLIRLKTHEEIVDFLDNQYEPVTPLEIAWGIENAFDWVVEELRELEASGRVLQLEEDKWVST